MSSPAFALDSSALLAYVLREPGYQRVRVSLRQGAVINTVNLAEVYTRMVTTSQRVTTVSDILAGMALTTLPFTAEDALLAANLVRHTRPLGLSLGDRACLATGIRLGLPVLTADRAWLRVQAGTGVELFRP